MPSGETASERDNAGGLGQCEDLTLTIRGVDTEVQDLLVTSGSQRALTLVAALLLGAGGDRLRRGEVGDDGEHPPVVVGGNARQSVPKMFLMCFSMVCSETNRRSAIALFERPSAIGASTSPSRDRRRGVADARGRTRGRRARSRTRRARPPGPG